MRYYPPEVIRPSDVYTSEKAVFDAIPIGRQISAFRPARSFEEYLSVSSTDQITVALAPAVSDASWTPRFILEPIPVPKAYKVWE